MTRRQKIGLTCLCILLLLVVVCLGLAAHLHLLPHAHVPPPPVDLAFPSPYAALPSGVPSVPELQTLTSQLEPLHQKIHPPGPQDWLANHREPGQTFLEYVGCHPVTLHDDRRIICIQPLGELPGRRKAVVELSAEFMGIYFGAEVRILETLSLDLIPDGSRRASRGFGAQIKSTTVLDDILAPRLPADAAAYIAFTAADLYPQDDWNFVFGQASLYNRVGVWSLARFGNPNYDEESFRTCLLRTLKTATHETGHIFSMYHCIRYECNMNGSNHQAESDAKPLWLCPECLAKVLHATGQEPKERYRRLIVFAQRHDLNVEAEFYERALNLLLQQQVEQGCAR